MIYGYCRATTPKQIELGYLEEQENKISERYFDSIMFKEKSLDMNVKPEFEKLMQSLSSGDTLVVTKLDRFAKSIEDAYIIIKKLKANKTVVVDGELKENNINIHILNIGLIDNSMLGNVIYDTLAAVDEFDKALLVERIQSGKNKAKKSNGFKEGRPKKYSQEQIDEALDMLNSYSYKKVEDITGISKSTLIRAKKDKKNLNSNK